MAYRNLPAFLEKVPEKMVPPFVNDLKWIVQKDQNGFTEKDWESFEQMYLSYAKRIGDGARIIREAEEKRKTEGKENSYDDDESMLPFLNALMHILSFLKLYAFEKNESFEEKMSPKISTLSRI